jgi:hypothetical protein
MDLVAMGNTNLRLGFKSLLNYLGFIFCIQFCFFVYFDDHMNFSYVLPTFLINNLFRGPFMTGAPKKKV